MKHGAIRLLSIILSLSLLLTLAACGDKPEPTSSEASVSSGSESQIFNPISEPSSIADNNEPTEPDKAVVDKLKEQTTLNKDTVGYLSIPNTTIDDFVVQSKKDNQFYLRLNNLGKYSFEGCYYADYRNTVKDRTSLDKNTTIYGHNLDDNKKTGVRFAQLMNYTDLEWAKDHSYIYLTTPTDEMVFKVFATFYTNWRNFDYIKNSFPDTAEFTALLTEAKASSEQVYDVEVSATDKILTLSTCTYKFGGVSNKDQRFVVMGRLLRAGEKDTDVVTVTKNPTTKVPVFTKK